MQVAYVCVDRGIPVFGQKGCSVHVQEIIRGFLKKGIKVKLFASRLGAEVLSDLKDVEIYEMPRLPHQDVEHFQEYVKLFNLAINEKLKEQGPFDFVYERYSLWGRSAMAFAQESHIPGILEVNAPLIIEEEVHRKLLHKDLARVIEVEVFDKSSHIIAVSDEVGRYVSQITAQGTQKKVKVLANGINPERFNKMESLREKNLDSEVFTIGFVGTLKPWHGLSTLLEAFKQLVKENKELHLLIVGDGPEKEKILKDIQSSNLEKNIHLTGAVHPELIPKWLSTMDIAVAPYPALDNFYFSPLKVYEYMAARLPVVVSRIGQLEKLIENNHTGLLFIPGDAASLKAKLKVLIQDKHLRAALGQAAQEKVFAEYTWDHVVKNILDLVESYNSSTQAVL